MYFSIVSCNHIIPKAGLLRLRILHLHAIWHSTTTQRHHIVHQRAAGTIILFFTLIGWTQDSLNTLVVLSKILSLERALPRLFMHKRSLIVCLFVENSSTIIGSSWNYILNIHLYQLHLA